jgi:hypothetical protein
MTSKNRAILAFVALGGSVLLTPVRARADSSVTRFPWTAPIANPCTGEVVDVSATSVWTTDTWSDGGGGFHFRWHYSLSDGSGVGATSGTAYRLSGSESNEIHLSSSGSQSVDVGPVNVRLTPRGGGPQFTIQVRHRLVADANGVQRVEVLDVVFACS